MSLDFVFNLHALPPLITAVAILCLGLIVVIRERGSRVSLLYLGYTFAASSWMMFAGIALLMPSEAAAFEWMRLATASVTLMPPALYHFTVVVLERERRDQRPVQVAWILAVIFLAASLATNALFDGFYHYSWGFFIKLRWPAFLFIFYFVALSAATIRRYWREFRRSGRDTTRHRRAKAFLIAFSIGYLGTLDFLPGLGVPYYPLSSAPMICMLILVSRAIWRYRLVDITPAFAAPEILETMNDALIVLDRERIVRLVNRATCEMLDCREQDMIGIRPGECAAGCGTLAKTLESVAEGAPVRNREVQCLTSEGERRTLSLSTSVMQNRRGERVATICLINDVTDRKQAEDERERLITKLREANEKLQSLDIAKTNFISMISHELRTPLTTIKAFVELILQKQAMPEARKVKLMHTVNAETDRLSRLINDLLDLARIESGAMRWQEEKLSIEELVRDVTAGMILLFENKGLRLTMNVDSSLPPIFGDRDRLVQAVTNILSNAVKFTRPGGDIRIALRLEAAPQALIVAEISDTGIGIQQAEMELIFERFYRSEDKQSAGIDGTGLGLAISRDIIERHGGKIWATSTYGKGSTFFFTLPVLKQEVKATKTAI